MIFFTIFICLVKLEDENNLIQLINNAKIDQKIILQKTFKKDFNMLGTYFTFKRNNSSLYLNTMIKIINLKLKDMSWQKEYEDLREVLNILKTQFLNMNSFLYTSKIFKLWKDIDIFSLYEGNQNISIFLLAMSMFRKLLFLDVHVLSLDSSQSYIENFISQNKIDLFIRPEYVFLIKPGGNNKPLNICFYFFSILKGINSQLEIFFMRYMHVHSIPEILEDDHTYVLKLYSDIDTDAIIINRTRSTTNWIVMKSFNYKFLVAETFIKGILSIEKKDIEYFVYFMTFISSTYSKDFELEFTYEPKSTVVFSESIKEKLLPKNYNRILFSSSNTFSDISKGISLNHCTYFGSLLYNILLKLFYKEIYYKVLENFNSKLNIKNGSYTKPSEFLFSKALKQKEKSSANFKKELEDYKKKSSLELLSRLMNQSTHYTNYYRTQKHPEPSIRRLSVYSAIYCINQYLDLYFKNCARTNKEEIEEYLKHKEQELRVKQLIDTNEADEVKSCSVEPKKDYYFDESFVGLYRLSTIYEETEDSDQSNKSVSNDVYEEFDIKEKLFILLLENTKKKLDELQEKTNIDEKRFNIEEYGPQGSKRNLEVDFYKIIKEMLEFYDPSRLITPCEKDFLFSFMMNVIKLTFEFLKKNIL